MNFTELYKKIRILDEESATERFQRMKAAGTLPAAPAGIPNAASGNVPGARPVGGGVTMSNPVASKTNIAPGQPLPANAGAVRGEAYNDASSKVAPVHTDGPTDAEGIIIGGPMGSMGSMGGMLGGMGHSSPPPQQDSVSMNVSLNGAGAQGVRDLMDILHNIEAGADHGNKHDRQEPIMGDMINAMAHEEQIGEVSDDGESWANSAHGDSGHHTHGIDSVITTGDDMHSKGIERAKVNGGGNPMQEALVLRLSQLYQAIKEDAGQQDLGNGFMLASIEAFGSTRPAVLDTQSNTYYILNQNENGGAIARTPAKYLTIKDGKTGSSMGGPQTNAAFQKAGLIK